MLGRIRLLLEELLGAAHTRDFHLTLDVAKGVGRIVGTHVRVAVDGIHPAFGPDDLRERRIVGAALEVMLFFASAVETVALLHGTSTRLTGLEYNRNIA